MKKRLRFFVSCLFVVMILSVFAGTDPTTKAKKKITVKKVMVTAPSGKTLYVAKGKKVRLPSQRG